jgi:GWxTD domain-containing protein
VDLDLVRFFPEGKSVILEGYLQISISAIELEKGPGSRANIDFRLTLEDSEKKEIYQNNWKYEEVITEEMLADDSQNLIESFALLMNPGKYTLKLHVSGVKDEVTHEFERQIEAPVESPILSDVLLASQIEVDTTGKADGIPSGQYNSFSKDGLLIVPNPCGRFVGATSLVYFYCQVQNQDTISSNVHMELEIIDSQEKLVKKLPNKDLKVNGARRIYVGAFSTGGLKEGSYILRAVATQNNIDGEKVVGQREKPFAVTAKRTIVTAYADINEYVDFSEEQLDSTFRLMRYLVSNKTSDLFNSLSQVGKKNFLHEFWKQKDPVPATPENEFRLEYERRLNHSNMNFSMGWEVDAVEGWLTDRGRVYTKFGEPDERIKRPNEYGSPPWELWKFFGTGYSYLFIDRNDNELYDLVFTNDRDEPIMPGWERHFPERVLNDIYTEFGYVR